MVFKLEYGLERILRPSKGSTKDDYIDVTM